MLEGDTCTPPPSKSQAVVPPAFGKRRQQRRQRWWLWQKRRAAAKGASRCRQREKRFSVTTTTTTTVVSPSPPLPLTSFASSLSPFGTTASPSPKTVATGKRQCAAVCVCARKNCSKRERERLGGDVSQRHELKAFVFLSPLVFTPAAHGHALHLAYVFPPTPLPTPLSLLPSVFGVTKCLFFFFLVQDVLTCITGSSLL